MMNDFFEDKWEWLSGFWKRGEDEREKEEWNHADTRKMFIEQFEIRQAMNGMQKRNYDVDEGWRKVRPTTWRGRVLRLSGAAAVILFCVSLIYWGVMPKAHEETLALEGDTISPGKAKAEFVLATGERLQVDIHHDIYLSELKGVVITNDTTSGRVRYKISENRREDTLAYTTFIVPKGGEYSLELPDGTVVWMNSASSLRFPEKFAPGKREVYLEGEAYFKVAEDPKHPFHVHAGAYEVRVLGTSFNVSAYPDDRMWHATLVEGSVLVSGEKQEVVMQPDEQYRIDRVNGEGELTRVVPELYTSWVNGKFYFKAYTFEELVKKLERWYDFKMLYVNEEIKQRRFSGVVNKHQPLQDMLKFLEMTSDVSFKVEGNAVTASIVRR